MSPFQVWNFDLFQAWEASAEISGKATFPDSFHFELDFEI